MRRWTVPRAALVVIAIVVSALIVRQFVVGVSDFRMWRAATNDPSARNFFFTSLEIDIAITVLYLLFGWVILYFLRRRQRKTKDVL
jgi:ABC-type spermidine/putrescine transport system permease subunit I